MIQGLCPFCLQQHALVGQCAETGETLPATYGREYEQVRPLVLAQFGARRHDTAATITALATALDRLHLAFPDSYADPVDAVSAAALRAYRRAAETHAKPPVASDERRPLLLSAYNLPEAGSRCLVLYDLAGRVASVSGSRVARFCTTTWLLVNLPEVLSGQATSSLAERFKTYRDELEQLEIDLQGRTLLVVYTDGDRVAASPAVREYLRTDPLLGLASGAAEPRPRSFHLAEYAEQLERASEALSELTRTAVPGGAAFLSMARARGMQVRFCVTAAALPASEERLSARTLDPLLWSLLIERQQQRRAIQLVADGADAERYGLAVGLWQALGNNAAALYQTGHLAPLATAGLRAPDAPAILDAPHLIGPLLERLPDASRVVVCSGRPPLDLADFLASPWQERVVLLMAEGDDPGPWPNVVAYRDGDSIATIAGLLHREAVPSS